ERNLAIQQALLDDRLLRMERNRAFARPRHGTFVVRRKRTTGEMTAVICSKSPDTLETCLASLRARANQVVRQIVVVAHEESGPSPSLHSVIERAGAAALTFRGAFDFAAMNNLGARIAERPNLLFLNDDVRATDPNGRSYWPSRCRGKRWEWRGAFCGISRECCKKRA